MLALVKTRPGPGNVELRKVPIPKVGPLDVLVKVKAASICGNDLSIYDWSYREKRNLSLPLIFGHEFCGEVVQVGKLVSEVKIGDFVSAETHITCGQCLYCRSGQSHLCPSTRIIGVHRDAAFAEFVAVPIQNVWINSSELQAEIAVIQEPFGLSAHAILVHNLVGRLVLVTGCGPIGLMAMAIAKASGADLVIATDPIPFRRGLAKEIDADFVFDPFQSDVGERIMQATGGQGIDVFLEMSGSPEALHQGLGLMRPGGRVTLMGIPTEPVAIDFWKEIIPKSLILHGVYGRLALPKWSRVRSMLYQGTIDLTPLVTHKFPMQDFEQAFEIVRSGECGKVMLLIGSKAQPSWESAASSTIVTASRLDDASPTTLRGYPWPDPALEAERRQLLGQIRDKKLYAIKQEVDSLGDMLQARQGALQIYRRRLTSPLLPPQEEAFLRSEILAIEKEIDENLKRLDELENVLAQHRT